MASNDLKITVTGINELLLMQDCLLMKSKDQPSGSANNFERNANYIFQAPELRSRRSDLPSPASDVWSVGAILYVLMTGGQRTFNTFENFNFKESVWTSCSQEIYDFMTQITISDPKKRPSAATLLSSSFITQSFTLEKEPLDYTLSEPGKAVLFRHNFSTLIDGLMC